MDKRIAIIDDDHIIQESLQELLGEAGYAVTLAADGVSGYELVKRENPDLVLADILLPRMHGIDLCEKIRACPELSQVPIILMTGVYKDVNLRMYVHKGLAQDFIEKPFREKDLMGKIERLIGKPPERVEVGPAAESAPRPARAQKIPHPHSVDRDLDDLITWARRKDKS